MELKNIPLDRIIRNPDQPRKEFPQEELEDLAATIKDVGVGQPILVKPVGDKYMIISGERRWRASGLAQQDTIPAVVRSDYTSGREALMRLIENVQRTALSTMEMARYIRYLKDEEDLTQEKIAIALGNKTNRSAVAHYLRLLTLPMPVQQMIDAGDLGFGHGKVLCGVEPEQQTEVARMAAQNSWSVRQLESFVQKAGKRKNANAFSKEVADALARMEYGASETMGYPVKIKHSGKQNSGKVVIDYKSLDELDGIMAKIGYDSDA